MYIVYYSTPTTMAVMEVPDSLTQVQISARVGGFNWYGSTASSGIQAIAQAKVDGFTYREPQEMAMMQAHLSALASLSEDLDKGSEMAQAYPDFDIDWEGLRASTAGSPLDKEARDAAWVEFFDRNGCPEPKGDEPLEPRLQRILEAFKEVFGEDDNS
jgi:hypothetical protein